MSAIYFLCSEFHWSINDIIHEDLIMLMLMLRQASYQQHGGMGLLDEESMKSMSWEELVKQNHARFAKMQI